MTQLLAALAELLGLAAFVATAPKQRPASPVSVSVAALAFVLAGAIFGAPVALSINPLPAVVSIGLVLVTLSLLLAGLKVLGVPIGASRSFVASLVYAAAFYIGAFGMFFLLRSSVPG